MNFLVNSFCDEHMGDILGVSIVDFDPEVYTDRAKVRIFNYSDFVANFDQFKPMGFMLDNTQLLMADTNARRAVSLEVFPFIYDQCQRIPPKPYDITDLILYGVHNGGATLINYSKVKEGEEPIVLPFSSYRVSNSSMNIYGAYRLPDGTFRTHSMLEMEDGTGKTVYCIFPAGVLGVKFSEFCTEIDTIAVDGAEMHVFKVDTTLHNYNLGVGEAFLNYLAYMVAYYSIGRNVLKAMAPPIIVEQEKAPLEVAERKVRKVKRNVSITHSYEQEHTLEVLERMNNADALNRLIADIPETRATVTWMQKVFASPWFVNGDQQSLNTVCANLAVECREQALKFGLELLSHRAHLMDTLDVDNSLPLILRGGGVDGQSIKRVSF